MNEDLISRKAVLDCFDGELILHIRTGKTEIQKYLQMVVDRINELPTIPQTDLELVDKKRLLNKMWRDFWAMEDKKTEEQGADYVGLPRLYEQNGFDCALRTVVDFPTIPQADSSVIAKIKRWSESPEYSYGERNVMKVILQELEDTIPQTDLTYDMVEQYAKENGFVIWTKEQTEDTLRKLLNYMDTEKHTDSDLAEFLLAKVKDFESVAIRVKHNTENLDRLIDYIHRVVKNAENGTFTVEKQTDSVLAEIKEEVEKLPRIKVGNSNSPTVKYCIDERLIYEVFEKHISRKEKEE